MKFFHVNMTAAIGLLGLVVSGLPAGGCGGREAALQGLLPSDPPETAFSISDESGLLAGPAAQGRVHDYSLDNGIIKVIIQKPLRQAGLASFGGIPIDISKVHSGTSPSADLFGALIPLINLEWTVNYRNFTATGDIASGTPLILSAQGSLDTYDYINVGFIVPIAQILFGQQLSLPARFNDRYEPFRYTELKTLHPTITTDYILKPGANYLEIRTTLHNDGPQALALPVGDLLAVSGRLKSSVAGSSDATANHYLTSCPALLFSSETGDGVSYAYVNPSEAVTASSCIRTDGVSASLQGDDLLGLLGTSPSHFSIGPGEDKTYSRYLVVGDGDIGSVLETTLDLLGLPKMQVTGTTTPGSVVTFTEFDHPERVIATVASDSQGTFSAELPKGDPNFGSGHYRVIASRDGVGQNSCQPDVIDLSQPTVPAISCALNPRGTVVLGNISDANGAKIAARITIVHETKGIVAVRYVNSAGTLETGASRRISLDPGHYQVVISHGPEYSVERKSVNLTAGQPASLDATLKRIMPVNGFVSADLHLHSTRSIDAAITPEERVIQTVGEGLNVILSTDHDTLTDYGQTLKVLRAAGAVTDVTETPALSSVVGDEVTPLSFGHFQVFPLNYDAASPTGGAPDYTLLATDIVGPDPDFVMSPGNFFQSVRAGGGEKVIQVNHIMDATSSYFSLIQLVTSPHFGGIPALTTFSNSIDFRMGLNQDPDGSPPFPPGTNPLLTTDFTAVELVTGSKLSTLSDLRLKALPIWFNLLNLGYLVTATASSDSHSLADPVGIPRNFITGAQDPESLAHNINGHHVVISNGPFITVKATNQNSSIPEARQEVGVGDMIQGDPITLEITATAPNWAPFDKVELFVNTDPLPAADTITDPSQAVPFKGGAKDFVAVGHLGNYFYQPFLKKDVAPVDDGTGRLVWKSDPIRINVAKDAWVAVLVYGSDAVSSLYPIAPPLGCLPAAIPAETGTVAPKNNCLPDTPFLPTTGLRAWALTNPIFIDADADGVFKSLYK